jgi:hypothetical protein
LKNGNSLIQKYIDESSHQKACVPARSELMGLSTVKKKTQTMVLLWT